MFSINKFVRSDRRREARKRQKQRQKDAERGSGTADVNEMADDEVLTQKPRNPKSQPHSMKSNSSTTLKNIIWNVEERLASPSYI